MMMCLVVVLLLCCCLFVCLFCACCSFAEVLYYITIFLQKRNDPIPLVDLVQILCFENVEEAAAFCLHHGLQILMNKDAVEFSSLSFIRTYNPIGCACLLLYMSSCALCVVWMLSHTSLRDTR